MYIKKKKIPNKVPKKLRNVNLKVSDTYIIYKLVVLIFYFFPA